MRWNVQNLLLTFLFPCGSDEWTRMGIAGLGRSSFSGIRRHFEKERIE